MISGMLETVLVQLYFGPGEVWYGPEGVDLTMFRTIVRNVKNVADRIWEAITTWLCKAFSVDSE
jgi:hypothetical protein